MNSRNSWFLAISVFLVFESLLLPGLFSKGIFMDGLIYSAVAHNMALDIGTIWNPVFSDSHLTPFYEHPPLSIYLHAVFFKIFGSGYWVNKILGHVFLALSAFFTIKIFHFFTKSYHYSWLVILLWLSVPNILWATNNNILENGMTFFLIASVYFILKSSKKNIHILWAGLFLTSAFLCKGVFALYVLGVPFLMWLFLKEISFKRMFFLTTAFVIVFLIPLVILYYGVDDAQQFFNYYFGNQVFRSVKSVAIVDSRFTIWGNFFSHSLIMLTLTTIVFLVTFKKHVKLSQNSKKQILLLIALCIIGIAPIMISLKQREFYILSVYAFLAIALAIYTSNRLKVIAHFKLKSKSKIPLYVLGTTFTLFLSTLLFYPKGEISRDKEMITLVEKFNKIAPKKSLVCTSKNTSKNWSLNAYFARYGSHTLTVNTNTCNYILYKANHHKKNHNYLHEKVMYSNDDYILLKK